MPEDVGRTGEIEMPARKRRPPLVTRDQVIDTAYRLVDEEGPRGLSMRRLPTLNLSKWHLSKRRLSMRRLSMRGLSNNSSRF